MFRADGNWPVETRTSLARDGLAMPCAGITMDDRACGFDESLGVIIHRFNVGAYICRCGEDNVAEKIEKVKEKQQAYGSPWQRRKPSKSTDN